LLSIGVVPVYAGAHESATCVTKPGSTALPSSAVFAGVLASRYTRPETFTPEIDTVALLGLLPAVAVVPPLTSFVAAEPPFTVTDPFKGALKPAVQLNVPPLTTFALGEHVGVGAPGRVAAFVIAQLIPTAAPGPLFVQVTVQLTAAPGATGFAGKQLVVEVVSALSWAKLLAAEPVAGTVKVIVPLVVVPATPPVCAVPPAPNVLYALV
jgi:hypothetical protein